MKASFMRGKTALVLAFSMTAGISSVQAQANPAAQPGFSDAKRLGAIHSEIEVLKADIQREELTQALDTMREAAKKRSAPPPPTPQQQAAKHVPLDPMVKAVEGVGSDRVALLVLDSGGTMEVRQGDKLPTGGVVKEISVNRVVVTTNGRDKSLDFTSGQVAASR